MKIIEPSVVVDLYYPALIIKSIEQKGRVSHKSEHLITPESATSFIRKLIDMGHESVFEHESISVTFVVDRGVSHELVRHRLATYTQESTRYVNYGKLSGEITVIRPFFWEIPTLEYSTWAETCREAERAYLRLLELGCSPQQARSVLPNSTKTEIVVTANIREWRHILWLRCAKEAHPQMRQVMVPLLWTFYETLSPLFDDISHDDSIPFGYYPNVQILGGNE